MTRRTALLIKASLIIVPMLLIVGGIYLWQYIVSAGPWREMEKEVQACLAAADTRDREGPSLRGLARTEGNRWEDYASAFRVAEGVDQAALSRFLHQKDSEGVEVIQKLVGERAAAFEFLRKGVAKGPGPKPRLRALIDAIPTTGNFECQQGMERVTSIGQLTFLGVCRARLSALDEALDLLIDLLQFASDLGRDGTIVEALGAFVVMDQVCQELHRLCVSGRLMPAQLSRVSRALETFDQDFIDHGHVMLNELASIGSSLLRGNYKGVTFEGHDRAIPLIPSPEEKFSRRRAVAEAFLRVVPLYRRASEVSRGPWSGHERLSSDLIEQAGTTASPFERLLLPGVISTERVWRQRRAQLRLLRITVEFIASGRALSLTDPFGPGDLRTQLDGSKLRAWSRDIDGEDNGGVPDRKKLTSDIVIEVTRP